MGEDILGTCLSLYKQGVKPIDIMSSDDKECIFLRKKVKELLENNGESFFKGYFMESQYRVNLIFAHFVFKISFTFSEQTIREALDIIKRYSKTPVNIELAEQEKKWLEERGCF